MEALGDAEAPEIAFLGRSNVGKSSLLGILLDRPKLVRVSKEPGRTRDINLFALEVMRVENNETEVKSICLVDLPGYGYVKVSKTEKD
jgi:GTP-binding protein